MPLIKSPSKKALQSNIKTEMEAHPGKSSRPQDLAIAYSVQRQARRKKMAEGGEVEHREIPEKYSEEHFDERSRDDEEDALRLASGGSVAEAIMERRKRMADGGEVDLEDNGEEAPLHGADWEGDDYDLADEHQPDDSNEHGDTLEDEDSHDMVSRIRAKMKAKRS